MLINPEDHLPLVFSIAKSFVKNELVKDSIEYSIGCEALLRACAGYNPEKKVEFSSYAHELISNSILQHLRHNKCQKRSASFENLCQEEWNGIVDEFQIDLEEEDFLAWLKLSYSEWPEEDRQDFDILLAAKVKKQSVEELACQFGVTRPTIYSRIQRIADKLKKRAA